MQKFAVHLLVAVVFLFGKSFLNAQSSVITFESNSCKPVFFTSEPKDCSPDPIWLVSIAKTNCQLSSNLVWNWELDYNSDGTVDYKGNGSAIYLSNAQHLEFGKHTMKWIVSDDCGSVASCVQSVELIEVKKPTPVTKLLEIDNWGPDCNIILKADEINNFSWDNCTPMEELRFKLVRSRDLPQKIDLQYVLQLKDTLVYTRSDLKLNDVVFFVIDNKDNFAYTTTPILNTKPCPYLKTKKYYTCLDVKNIDGRPITKLKFSYSGKPVTDVDVVAPGVYCFSDHYYKNIAIDTIIDGVSGISILDHIKIRNRILGIVPKSENQKISDLYVGSISSPILQKIRKEVLGIPDLENDWKFNLKSTLLWDTLAEEEYSLIGYRIGDVTGNANLNSSSYIKEQSIGTLNFVTNDILLIPNKIYTIPFKLTPLDTIIGFQAAIRPLNSDLQIIEANGTKVFNGENSFLSDGSIRMMKSNYYINSLKSLDFTLKVKSTKLQYLSEAITNEDPTIYSEAYNIRDKIYDLKLKFVKTKVDPYTEKAEIVSLPNPFSTSTTLRFQSEQTESVDILIFNQLGQVVHQDKLLVYEGLNEYEYRHQSQTSELLYCKIVGKDGSKNGKMLFVKQ